MGSCEQPQRFLGCRGILCLHSRILQSWGDRDTILQDLSRGWESCDCNPSGFHAASERGLRQLLEISGTGRVPVGSAPPAPGPLFAYLEL